jgi:DNA-binding FrmR family transcriptional regulator
MSATESDPAQIERELDATRSRLGGHLDALQNRLSPGQSLDDVMDQLRANGGAEFGQNLLASVRNNPLPAALTGIGLAWMMAANGRAHATVAGTRDMHTTPDPLRADIVARLRAAERGVQRGPHEPDDAYDERLVTARGEVVGIARHAEETTASFGARVAAAVASAQDAVAGGMQDARARLGEAGDALRDAAGSVRSSLSDTAESLHGAAGRMGDSLAQGRESLTRMMGSVAESPVLLASLGLAAGAVLGALLPVTEQERLHLAGLSGQLRDSASDAARNVAAQASAVAQAAVAGGRDATEQHGLAPGRSPGAMVDAALRGELASNAAEAAHAVLRAGDEAARDRLAPRSANGAT